MSMSKTVDAKITVISKSEKHNQEMCVAVSVGHSQTFFRPINPTRPTKAFNRIGGTGRKSGGRRCK